MSDTPSEITEQARTAVRMIPWQTVIAGAGGASVLALLAVAGFGPLISAIATGTLSLAQVQSWLANLGANALSGWVASWATDATVEVLGDDGRAEDLDQRAAADPAVADALARLVVAIDAIPQSIDAIAQEVGAQSDILLTQHQLLQRIAADMERQGCNGSELRRLAGDILPAEADRVIGTVRGHIDQSTAVVLAELRAWRDLMHPPVLAVPGVVQGDLNTGDIAGRDIHKPQVGSRGVYAPNSTLTIALPPVPVDPRAAIARFEQLPTDALPAYAPLPAGSRAPARNPHFVGREADLLWIAATLVGSPEAQASQTVALTGLGGVGKSDLVTTFAYRYGQYFAGGVFALSFADPAGVTAEIAACGGTRFMQLYPSESQLGLAEQVDRVLGAWRQPIPRLLIFDACEDEALFQHWRNAVSAGGCRILVTSRRGVWSRSLGVSVRTIEPLGPTESVMLLAAHRQDLRDHPALAQIGAELGGLPLALHLAGSYLETYEHHQRLGDPARLLVDLRDRQLLDHPALQGIYATPSPTAHDLHVGRTFALSYDRLEAGDLHDSLARTLLARAAYLAPSEPIPRDLAPPLLDRDVNDDTQAPLVEQSIRRLATLGLISQGDAGSLRLHRLLALFVRQAACEEMHAEAAERVLMAYVAAKHQLGAPTLLLSTLSHLRYRVQAAAERGDMHAARLHACLGAHLYQLGDYAEALTVYEHAATLLSSLYGAADAELLRVRDGIANVLGGLGRYHEAVAISAATLAARERSSAVSPDNLAENLEQLAALLQRCGDSAGAIAHYERALALRTETQGELHHKTLAALYSLSALLSKRDPPAAEGLIPRACAIEQRLLTEPCADLPTALSLVWAMFLALLRLDLAVSEQLWRKASTFYQEIMFTDHPDISPEIRRILPRPSAGSPADDDTFEQTLMHFLGEDHPQTAQGLTVLAMMEHADGRRDNALRLYDKALAVQERSRRNSHPDTALILLWRGKLLTQFGDRIGARAHLLRALDIYTSVLGADHPTTQQCRADLELLTSRCPRRRPLPAQKAIRRGKRTPR